MHAQHCTKSLRFAWDEFKYQKPDLEKSGDRELQ